MNLGQFIETYQAAITQAVLRTYPPVYTAQNRDQWGFDLRQMRRRPLGAQSDAIRAVAVSLQRHRGTNLVGEMGTGKTTIGAAAAYLAGFSSVLVLCPPHCRPTGEDSFSAVLRRLMKARRMSGPSVTAVKIPH